jgi:hypothetical protein
MLLQSKNIKTWDFWQLVSDLADRTEIKDLLKMIQIELNRFVELYHQMEISALEKDIDSQNPGFRKVFDEYYDFLTEMRLPLSVDCADRVQFIIQQNDSEHNKYLHEQLVQLNSRVYDEIRRRVFLLLLERQSEYYSAIRLFGKEIYVKFPELASDIDEAGKCFGLERYTACVFHLMRVMERTIQRFGKRLHCKLPSNLKDARWYEIQKAIKDVIDKLPYSTTREKNRKDKYYAMYAHLDSVRSAWRNKVMHPKEAYAQDDALRILQAVQSFLGDF